MPELPEVETVVRTVSPKLRGRRIVDVRVLSKKPWAGASAKARGQTIHNVRRHGKFILLELDRGLLAIHLGMTGKLVAAGDAGAYTRVILTLDRGRILFDDVR